MSRIPPKEVQTTELVERNNITSQIVSLEEKEGLYSVVVKEVDVPPDLVYKIGYGRGSFLASFYDLIAREMAIQFGPPEVIFEDEYRVRARVQARYWNRSGKMVVDSEEYEVDCRLLYEKARFGWEEGCWKDGKYTVKRKAEIVLKRDPKHPSCPPQVEVVLPDDAEKELYENFITLRRNKLAKAITCTHRRLIQRALGIKGFTYDEDDKKWQEKVKLTFIAFLPAEADKKAGIKAIQDLGGDAGPAETIIDAETEKGGKGEDIGPGPELKEKKETKKTPAGTPAGLVCTGEGCGAKVSKKVADYSKEHHGKVLCMDCQKKQKGG